MMPVPVACRALLAVARRILPAGLRAGWQREWDGKLWFWQRTTLDGRGDRRAQRDLFLQCARAVGDAIRIRFEGVDLVRPSVLLWSGVALVAVLVAASGGLPRTRLLFQELPIRGADRVMLLWQSGTFRGQRLGVPLAKIGAWNREATQVEATAGYVWYRSTLGRKPGPGPRVRAARVTPLFFDVLRVPAWKGTLPGSCQDCAALSYETWKEAFGADPGVIGQAVWLDQEPFRITGILPPNFRFDPVPAAIWVGLSPSYRRDGQLLNLVGGVTRLRPGALAAEAENELREIARRIIPRRAAAFVRLMPLEQAVKQPGRLYLSAWLLGFAALALWTLAALVWDMGRKGRRGSCSWRYRLFFFAKAGLMMAAVFVTVIEFTPATLLSVPGGTTFSGDLVAIFLFVAGCSAACGLAAADQRQRCRQCLRRLELPVRIGDPGSVLLQPALTELVCPNGHGILYEPGGGPASGDPGRWQHLDESWQDLFSPTQKR